ncbi:CbtA family protein [Actinoplanes sp. NPDC051861]|uniref:CbtA family protein n=1 Tax=Actinoplanes sp. NPDC051861 TaxID=3155170 RepID=UPI003418FD07
MPLKHLLLRGLLAGLIAGLLAGGFAHLFGEPHIDAAIAIEEAAGPHTHGGEELVSRGTQSGIGLFLATGLYGLALGGIFAVAYTLLRRRLHTTSDARAALTLAAGTLIGLVIVPFVKYPPNPPAVGDPATIDQRTIAYLAAVALGLVAVWSAALAARTQNTDWRRATAATLGFLAVVTVAHLLLPTFDEVPATFPATLLWNFRISSLGTQVVLWTTLGLTYAALLTPRRRPADAPEVKVTA